MFSETIFSINCTFKTIIDLRFPQWFSEFIIFDLQVINRVIYYFVSRSFVNVVIHFFRVILKLFPGFFLWQISIGQPEALL